jgi:PAS domain S-box-containing protein
VLVAGGLGFFSLSAWWLGHWRLEAFGGVFVPMVPSTAILFILLSGALWLLRRREAKFGVRVFSLCAVGITVLASAVVVAQHFTSLNLSWERWLSGANEFLGEIPVRRMAPVIAGAFLLTAVSLLVRLPLFEGRNRLRIAGAGAALLNGLFACLVLWGYAGDVPMFYGSDTTPMSVLTAVSFLGLNVSLLIASVSGFQLRRISSSDAGLTLRKEEWRLLVVFAAAALGICLASIFYVRARQASLRAAIVDELTAIANLKVGQITHWKKEWLGDARFLMRAPSTATTVAEWFAHPDSPALRADILNLLDRTKQQSSEYKAVVLLDEQLTPRLAIPESAAESAPGLRGMLEEARQADDVIMGDLQVDERSDRVHLDLLVPVFSPDDRPTGHNPEPGRPQGRPIAAILLRIDPYEYLYPLVQHWPVPSKTAETLIVRREGDSILYLNELRHRAGTTLKLRSSIRDQWLLAARILRGETGMQEGVDYRGVPVLGVGLPIPNSSWFMVAKVDQAEIYTPLLRQAWTTAVIVTVLLCSFTLGVGLFWWRKTAEFLREGLADKQEIERLNCLYAALRQVNQAVVRVGSRQELLDSVCRIMVEYARFPFAWIGEHDEAQRMVKPVASAGTPREFLEGLQFFTDERKEGWSPTITAVHEGRPEMLHETGADQDGRPWRAKMARHGFHSAAAVPIFVRGKVWGNLTVYSPEPAFFRDKEIKLLAEAASDISFALDRLEDQAEHRRTQEAMRESEQRFRSLYENATIGLYRTTPDGRILLANPTLVRMLGYDSVDKLAQVNLEGSGFSANAPRREFREQIERAGEIMGLEATWLRKDGSSVHVRESARCVRDAAGNTLYYDGTVEDITERKQAERALKENVENLRRMATVVSDSNDAIILHDLEGKILAWNRGAKETYGYTEGEALGMNVRDIVAEPDREAALTLIERIKRGDIVKSFELRRIAKDGRILDVWLTTTLLTDDKDKPVALATTERDITERKKAEERLRLQGSALEAAANAIVITDRTGAVEWVNPAFCVLTGYSAAEAIGRNLRELVKSGEHDAAFFKHLWTTILAGQVWQSELVNRRKDGILYTEFQTITPVRNDRGEIKHFIAIKEDITARKQSEAHVREQTEVIDRSPLMIVISDLSDRTTYFSGGASRLLGIKKEEILGRNPDDLFPPETMQRLSYGRDVTLATESWRGEVPFLTRDGRSVLVEFVMALIKDDAGKPRARISIGTDVTEKRLFEEQALRAQRLDNLGLLAGGIAHDLNNALAPIIMAGPLLHQYLSDPGALRMLGIIEQSSARGAALVRQMVSFARGTGTEKQLVQVRHALEEVIDLATSTFPKSIRIESHLPNDLWPVLSDPTKLHQVFLNLCVNARDAMPAGGELTLSAANRTLNAAEATKVSADARSGNFITVEVRDTGTGIPPEVLEKIWDPFFTTKREGKGTGLGLSTVRSIVRQHDGFVTVLTFPMGKSHHGTTFTVYLPAAKGEKKREASAHPFQSQQGNGELILVVDDEKPVCELTTKILTGGGYNVVAASDGVEAIVAFIPRAADVRLLLTDLDMPIVNGQVLANALRRMKPDLLIVAMSGAGSKSDETHKKFTTAFLTKPFEAEALLSIVRRTLDDAPLPRPKT